MLLNIDMIYGVHIGYWFLISLFHNSDSQSNPLISFLVKGAAVFAELVIPDTSVSHNIMTHMSLPNTSY